MYVPLRLVLVVVFLHTPHLFSSLFLSSSSSFFLPLPLLFLLPLPPLLLPLLPLLLSFLLLRPLLLLLLPLLLLLLPLLPPPPLLLFFFLLRFFCFVFLGTADGEIIRPSVSPKSPELWRCQNVVLRVSPIAMNIYLVT